MGARCHVAEWRDRLRLEVPRDQLPAFLTDLQALVAALREEREWESLLTQRLQEHASLVLEYLDPGPKKDQVAKRLQA